MIRAGKTDGSRAPRAACGCPRGHPGPNLRALVTLLAVVIGGQATPCLSGPLPGLPPLQRFVEEARSDGDGITFEPADGRWEKVEVASVVPVSGRLEPFAEWSWWIAEDGFRGRAEDRAGEWLRLGELDLGDRRIRASKDVGDRIRIYSFTGYQASSQRMLRVDYRLRRGLVLLSEARERGESRIVVEREQTFR